MELVLLIGIPATGKSSFCREKFFRTHVRLNLDMLGTRRKERLLMEACLAGKTKFVVDWEAQVVTCPAGKKSLSFLPCAEPEAKRCSFHVRFAKKDCDACAHRGDCTRAKTEPRELMLQTREEYEALHAARRRQKTPEFKEAYKARSGIESTHEQGIRRRAMGFGRTRHAEPSLRLDEPAPGEQGDQTG